jgi:hypothetical protein
VDFPVLGMPSKATLFIFKTFFYPRKSRKLQNKSIS